VQPRGQHRDLTGCVFPLSAERGSPGHVQIATVNVHSPFEFPEVEHGNTWEAGERFDGWWVTLDEAGIDDLIKTLHKAKRQAFGGDKVDVHVNMPDGMAPTDAVAHVTQALRKVQSGTVRPAINEPVDIDLNEVD
jgi:hypothetical protein